MSFPFHPCGAPSALPWPSPFLHILWLLSIQTLPSLLPHSSPHQEVVQSAFPKLTLWALTLWALTLSHHPRLHRPHRIPSSAFVPCTGCLVEQLRRSCYKPVRCPESSGPCCGPPSLREVLWMLFVLSLCRAPPYLLWVGWAGMVASRMTEGVTHACSAPGC